MLHSVKPYVNGPDELSRTFLEMKGHFYMHAGTFLLKMAQNNEARWRDACELAALCYLKSFCVSPSSVCACRDCASGTLSLCTHWTAVFQDWTSVFKAVSSPNLPLPHFLRRFQVVKISFPFCTTACIPNITFSYVLLKLFAVVTTGHLVCFSWRKQACFLSFKSKLSDVLFVVKKL